MAARLPGFSSLTRTWALGCYSLLAGAFIAGCGGGGDAAPSAPPSSTASPPPASPPPAAPPSSNPPPPAGADNEVPTIAGAPSSSILFGSQYSFTPTASDTDGDALTFSVENLPPWAAFDASTGQLSGVPSQADVGSYDEIVISVSDGNARTTLGAFSIDVVAVGLGSATLSWEAPLRRSDGTPLTGLAGFRIYWGPAQDAYTNSVTIDNPSVTTYTVEQLTPGTWYFVATAFDESGGESAFSGVGTKTIL